MELSRVGVMGGLIVEFRQNGSARRCSAGKDVALRVIRGLARDCHDDLRRERPFTGHTASRLLTETTTGAAKSIRVK